jgi:hypothetical protein
VEIVVAERTADRGDADARNKRQEQAADQDQNNAAGDAARRETHYDRLTGCANM